MGTLYYMQFIVIQMDEYKKTAVKKNSKEEKKKKKKQLVSMYEINVDKIDMKS